MGGLGRGGWVGGGKEVIGGLGERWWVCWGGGGGGGGLRVRKQNTLNKAFRGIDS